MGEQPSTQRDTAAVPSGPGCRMVDVSFNRREGADNLGRGGGKRPFQVVAKEGLLKARIVDTVTAEGLPAARDRVGSLGIDQDRRLASSHRSPPEPAGRLPRDRLDKSGERSPPIVEMPDAQQNIERNVLVQIASVFFRQFERPHNPRCVDAGAFAKLAHLFGR